MSRILVVDDEARMAGLIRMELEEHAHSVSTAGDGAMALELVGRNDFDLVLTDLRMPGMDGLTLLKAVKEQSPETAVVLMTAYASAQTAVSAMKEGAYDYLIKPFEMDELLIMVERIDSQRRLLLENTQLRENLGAGEVSILGESEAMREVFELVGKVADQDATVLIEGESGTGKELIARSIHAASHRAGSPFVVVNCAVIPDTLIESDLFGHEKGAFTGADRKKLGRFELADGGTVFLDEISELSGQAQVKLLRVLQERTVERLGGGVETIRIDVRVLAATNRNLQAQVSRGGFREDLFYRLNVFPIHLPPLRERAGDIPLLAGHFASSNGAGGIAPDAVKILQQYRWPGNVRELENVIERAVILAGPGEEITARFISHLEAIPESDEGAPRVTIPEGGVDIEDLEKQHILEALRKSEGNKSEAARLLHMSRRRLYSRMQHHDIEY